MDCRSTMAWMWRLASVVMALFFGLATIVQHNDPDWLVWMCIYATPCTFSLVQALAPTTARDAVYRAIMRATLVFYVLLDIYLLASFFADGKGTFLDSEEGREFLGVLIIALWLGISLYFTDVELAKGSSTILATLVGIFCAMPLTVWLVHWLLEIELC